MAVRLMAVTFDAADPEGVASFWGGLLEREPTRVDDLVILPGTDTQVGLAFEHSDAPARPRLHLHVTSDHQPQEQVVARALALGATHVDVGQRPDEPHVVLADPGGNAFCVLNAGNSFVAGCGVLGEIACDGSRDTGVFWSSALGWPLVWDENGETAVQSPAGGTKVAWGGLPVAPIVGEPGDRLDLVVDDAAAVERLLALGARPLAPGLFTDPDGNRFRVRSATV